MATLLSICQDALKDVGNQLVPSAIVNNGDATAELCLSLVNRLGRELALKHDWEMLLEEHTVATAQGTASYALPADFRKFARLTQWDRVRDERVAGPVSPSQWQALQGTAPGRSHFRVRGGMLHLHPTPTAGGTFAFEYYSRHWCAAADGTGRDAFAADTDVARLDGELIILGLKARFLRSRGEPYDDALIDFNGYRDTLVANDNGPGSIRFGVRAAGFAANIPDTGYGA